MKPGFSERFYTWSLGLCLGWMLASLLWAYSIKPHDSFSQDNFPCHEDEALLFSQEFGPDKVGCMNVENIK